MNHNPDQPVSADSTTPFRNLTPAAPEVDPLLLVASQLADTARLLMGIVKNKDDERNHAALSAKEDRRIQEEAAKRRRQEEESAKERAEILSKKRPHYTDGEALAAAHILRSMQTSASLVSPDRSTQLGTLTTAYLDLQRAINQRIENEKNPVVPSATNAVTADQSA